MAIGGVGGDSHSGSSWAYLVGGVFRINERLAGEIGEGEGMGREGVIG